MLDAARTNAQFQTTHCWDLIAQLKGGDEVTRRQCLTELYRVYASPVYAYFRTTGRMNEAQAWDLTQEFFLHKVLEGSLFEKADPDRGRMRTLIKAALKNFAIDEHRKAESRGKSLTVRLDIERVETALKAANLSPDDVYEREWREAVVQEARRLTERHYTQFNKPHLWQLYEAHALRPLTGTGDSPGFEALAIEHGFRDAHSARSALQGVGKAFRAALEAVVRSTVRDPTDLWPELAVILGESQRTNRAN